MQPITIQPNSQGPYRTQDPQDTLNKRQKTLIFYKQYYEF